MKLGKFTVNAAASPRTTFSSFTTMLDKFNENGGIYQQPEILHVLTNNL